MSQLALVDRQLMCKANVWKIWKNNGFSCFSVISKQKNHNVFDSKFKVSRIFSMINVSFWFMLRNWYRVFETSAETEELVPKRFQNITRLIRFGSSPSVTYSTSKSRSTKEIRLQRNMHKGTGGDFQTSKLFLSNYWTEKNIFPNGWNQTKCCLWHCRPRWCFIKIWIWPWFFQRGDAKS